MSNVQEIVKITTNTSISSSNTQELLRFNGNRKKTPCTFKAFMQLPANKSILPLKILQESVIAGKLKNVLSVSDSHKLSAELVQLVNKDSFISELSDMIGYPKEYESENEFVNRSKKILRDLLDKKLSKP